jgi:hypothetical protein
MFLGMWRGLAGWGVAGSCRVENGGVLQGGEWRGLAGWRMVGSCRVGSGGVLQGGVLWGKVTWVVAGCGVAIRDQCNITSGISHITITCT